MLFTIAVSIQVAPAARTQTFAVFATNSLHRRRQQHLLAQNIFQQKTFALIIADFGLGFADRNFFAAPVHALRAVEQVKARFTLCDTGSRQRAQLNFNLCDASLPTTRMSSTFWWCPRCSTISSARPSVCNGQSVGSRGRTRCRPG